jgi:hypothetical protein
MKTVTAEADLIEQQRHSRDNAIACLKTRITRYQQVPIELKVQLQPHLEVLSGLKHKLSLNRFFRLQSLVS